MLVKVRVSLDMPAVAVLEHSPVHASAVLTPLFSSSIEPQLYSPPDLYTLHSSLLI